jgi:non-ribosomal peptide synthetase component F
VVGSPVAGRRSPALEDVIGFFVNMLALRVSCSGNPTFRELLQRTRATCLDADAHQDVPFEKVVESLQTTRDISRQALFQVAFAVQNAPDDDVSVAGLSLVRVESPTCTSKFDLTMTLTEDAGEWRGVIEYSTDLFDEDRIARLARHYVRLLESIVADPDEAIDRLEMLDESERRDLLAAGASARVEMPARCLHEGFEAQAAARPDAVAVACDGRTLTYAAVDRAATALALRLQRLGVGPEVRVGVHLERSLELPIAMLAVMKAGGGYVPLDPELPLERLHWLIADTAAPVVVTQRSLRERLPRTGSTSSRWPPNIRTIRPEPS